MMGIGRLGVIGLVLWTLSGAIVQTQSFKKFIPPPLHLGVPLQTVREHMSRTLEHKEIKVDRQDQNRGLVLTEYQEYSSGPLTASHIAKIGNKPKITDGEWVRVQYQYEILMELIKEKETVVTVNTHIKALKRDYFGSQEWVKIVTNGELEQELLSAFGQSLFGQSFTLEGRKRRFWEQAPSFSPDLEGKRPAVVGPGRSN